MRGSTQNYVDFSGGLNTQAAPYVIDAKQVRDALNVHTTPQGSIRKRNGFAGLAITSDVLTSLAPSNTSAKTLIGAGGTNIVKITQGGVVSTLKSSVSSNVRWEWTQAQTGAGPVGPLYGMNGTDTPQVWDGAAASTSNWTATTGTTPNGTIIKFHGSRIWVAGTSANPSRLRFSGISGTAPDPLNWDSNNFVDFEPNDGQQITALGISGPNLLVFKPRKTYVVYDIVTGANRKLSTNIGCIAPRSVVETPQGTFFLSETDGVLSTDGSKIRRVSDNVLTDFLAAAQSQPTLANACATYNDGTYYLSISSGLVRNDVTYEFDLTTNSWWKHDCASNQFALLDPVGSPILYSANPAGASVQKAFVDGVFADAGSAYAGGSYFTTAYFIWGDPGVMKRVRQVRAEGIGFWIAQCATNFTDSFQALDGEIWDYTGPQGGDLFGGAGTFAPSSGGGTFAPDAAANIHASYRYYTPGRARAWSFKFVNTNSADFQIYELTASIDPTKD